MRNSKQLLPLGAIPYYGGKAKMAELISSMLDYDNTDTYVEPFGGGYRVGINKSKRHKQEIYFDISLCVYALFKVLTNREMTQQLVDKLLQTDCTEETFNECRKQFEFCEANYVMLMIDEIDRRTKQIVNDERVKYDIKAGRLTDVNKLFNFRLNGFCCDGYFSDREYRLLDGFFLEVMIYGRRSKTGKGSANVNVEGYTENTILGRTLDPVFYSDFDDGKCEHDLGLGDMNYLTPHLEEIHKASGIEVDGVITLLVRLNRALEIFLERESEYSDFRDAEIDKLRLDAEYEADFWLKRYAKKHGINEEELRKGKGYYKLLLRGKWRREELIQGTDIEDCDAEEATLIGIYDLFARKASKWVDNHKNQKSEKKYSADLEAYAKSEFKRIETFYKRYYGDQQPRDMSYEECVQYYHKMRVRKKESGWDYCAGGIGDIELLNEFYSIFREHEKKRILFTLDKAREVFSGNHQGYGHYLIDKSLDNYDLVDMAYWTYIVYRQGRDGVGKVFAKGRYKLAEDFYKTVSGLLEASDRMQGVEVLYGCSMDFIREHVDNDRVMMYLDPPYLESKEAIEQRANKQIKIDEFNPGQYYKDGWSRSRHREFLNIIKDGNAKMLVSNYTDEYRLYDEYLTPARGWTKLEYETKTTIVSGEAKDRVECLWKNY